MFMCAYNTSEYPRPSIYNQPFCYNNKATQNIVRAMSSLGPYHKQRLESTLQWDAEETYCSREWFTITIKIYP
jgi:hypothetical protein